MNEAKAILTNYHELIERQYLGDAFAIDVLNDLQTALALSKLTDRQALVLRLVINEDMTQSEASEALGITQSGISATIRTAFDKVQAVYDKWEALSA